MCAPTQPEETQALAMSAAKRHKVPRDEALAGQPPKSGGMERRESRGTRHEQSEMQTIEGELGKVRAGLRAMEAARLTTEGAGVPLAPFARGMTAVEGVGRDTISARGTEVLDGYTVERALLRPPRCHLVHYFAASFAGFSAFILWRFR